MLKINDKLFFNKVNKFNKINVLDDGFLGGG